MAPVVDEERADRLRRRARAGARLLPRLLARARRRSRRSSSTATTSTRRRAGQARRRLLRLHGPVGAPVRDAQLHRRRPSDVLTMAHELGHGVHADAGPAEASLFEFSTPLTVAETASIFGETIVLERLLERAPDATARLSLLAESLDGAVAAVFRQVAMNRFEDRVHAERRDGRRALARRVRRRLARHPGRPARRLGRARRGLRLVVVLRPALHRHARLRLRVRLRPPAGALGLSPLRGGGRGVRRRPTSSCCAPAARARPRSSARSSASTSPTPASGRSAST